MREEFTARRYERSTLCHFLLSSSSSLAYYIAHRHPMLPCASFLMILLMYEICVMSAALLGRCETTKLCSTSDGIHQPYSRHRYIVHQHHAYTFLIHLKIIRQIFSSVVCLPCGCVHDCLLFALFIATRVDVETIPANQHNWNLYLQNYVRCTTCTSPHHKMFLIFTKLDMMEIINYTLKFSTRR